MDFWFEFFNIHMNEKGKTWHDYHGFKMVRRKYFSNFDYFLVVQ
jgi:hypothetical protein